MLRTFLTAFDWFGTAVFAVTGALVASRKRMDIAGFILLGCVTGMGGGTMRDAMLGALPVFWVREPPVDDGEEGHEAEYSRVRPSGTPERAVLRPTALGCRFGRSRSLFARNHEFARVTR